MIELCSRSGGEGEHARRLVVARVRMGGGEQRGGDGALGPGHAHAAVLVAVAAHLDLAHAVSGLVNMAAAPQAPHTQGTSLSGSASISETCPEHWGPGRPSACQ